MSYVVEFPGWLRESWLQKGSSLSSQGDRLSLRLGLASVDDVLRDKCLPVLPRGSESLGLGPFGVGSSKP